MQTLLLLALVAVAYGRTLEGDLSLFKDFKATYGRTYTGAAEEYAFKCFTQNLDINDKLNSMGTDARWGINQFADLCPADFQSHHNLMASNKTDVKRVTFSKVEVASALDAVDWRSKGAVTHVKNQGFCGSCWSFSTTGNVEGQVFLATGALKSVSEEELVQCSHNGNQGCNGGLMDYAFQWITSNGGIDSEGDYPYTSGSGVTGNCNNAKLGNVVSKINGYQDIAQSEDQMKAFVSSGGPLSIAVDASSGWQTYQGGIMSNCYGTSLDHGVLIVGYDTSYSTPYWIVKNSWGASWGESGYIRLQYGTNQCGLNQDPSSSKA